MIEFSNVSKVYPNGVVGLDDVNLTIEQGEFVGIIGLSGAGKSTLLRTINRMHDITSGTLTVDGQEVKNLKGKQLRKFRRNIGMIFQSFNLVTRTTVIRNVLMAKVPEMPFWRVLLGIFKKEDKLNALEALDKVGILDKAYIVRISSPADSSSVWRLRARSHRIRRLFLRMSRWRRLIR